MRNRRGDRLISRPPHLIAQGASAQAGVEYSRSAAEARTNVIELLYGLHQ